MRTVWKLDWRRLSYGLEIADTTVLRKYDDNRDMLQYRADAADALAVETSAIQDARWSEPPAGRIVRYARPEDG